MLEREGGTVAIKGLFGSDKGKKRRRRGAEDKEHTVDDLIVLERYEEAEERLKARLKDEPNDLHAHLKLAEVHTAQGRGADAVDDYVFVAEEYARDGFYDKGIALLSKAARLAPADENVRLKVEAFQEAKKLEHKRFQAVEGIKERSVGGGASFSPLEFQALWHKLVQSPLVQRLPADQLRRIFTHVEVWRLEAQTELGRRNESGSELYYIGLGVVGAFLPQDEGEAVELLRFGSGDIIGESVFFERQGWPADYRVTEDAVLFVLTRPALEGALTGNPDPRRLLEALRFQEKDRDVVNAVKKLSKRA